MSFDDCGGVIAEYVVLGEVYVLFEVEMYRV